MAIEASQKKTVRLVPALACTVPFMLGMVLIYVGERLMAEPMRTRLILDGLGAAGILWALLARAVNWLRARGDSRSVQGMVLTGYLGGLLSLLLYAVQLDPVREVIFPWIESPDAVKRYKGILLVLWPIVWISSILPVLFMETSFASMARAPQIERRRVAFSAASGLTLAWVLATLFVINYLADVHNRKWDMSLLKTSSPSEDAGRLVSNLQDTFEIILFYPDVNEVREELLSYFEELGEQSDRLQVRACDQVLEPKLAEELGARKNGSIVYRYGDKKEAIPIGLKTNDALGKLSKLDEEFQKTFLKLVAEKKEAYFVTGHGERRYDWSSEKDHRATVKGLKSILRAQNFDVKPLGIAQGLASEVPDDASLLLVVDPTEDFLPEEITSLKNYLNKGGKLWVILDPESSSNISGLLEEYGVRFVGTPLANDKYYMRANYNKSDKYNLFTNRTSSHPSVNTLSRNTNRLAVVLLKPGYLEKLSGKKGDPRIVMTLRSMPMTWADESRELKTSPREKDKKTYDFSAAISMAVEEKVSGEPEAGKKEMRMLVLADADAFSDKVLSNLGNYYLFDDGLKWLFQEESLVGGVGAEEDVRILHTKEEDVIWYYTTIFGVPLAILGVGILYNGLRRRRRAKNV